MQIFEMDLLCHLNFPIFKHYLNSSPRYHPSIKIFRCPFKFTEWWFRFGFTYRE